ncbi:MAG: sugar phosphate nucleotidyltransferase [Sulfuritalea sp.]|nr:sugar phosphate nucleotidyltransferase [Sulfuritalea sp.]
MPVPELLVLAGGFGSRLQSVVSDVPKPLAPVTGRPYLDYLIDSWIEQGVERMSFLLHHKAELLQEFIDAKQRQLLLDKRSCQLRFLIEPSPLGTGGAVAHAVRSFGLKADFLVANADTWLGSGIQQLSQLGAPGIAIVEVANALRYGVVRVEDAKVIVFEEKQALAGRGWINAGLYNLPAELFSEYHDGHSFSIERDVFPKLVSRHQLKATALTTDFIDIGIPEDYFRFCRWIESSKAGTL